MGTTVSMNSNFNPEVVKDIFSKVKGYSSIARLSNQTPVAFTGNDIFTFALDNEVNIVGESDQKTNGGATVETVTMTPIKVEYGARVTDEFLYASEEKQLDMLGQFTDGYAKKIARGIDIMALHGVNPRDKAPAQLIGKKCLDKHDDVTAITYDSSALLANLEAAVAAIGEYDVTGFALSKDFASGLSQVVVGNNQPFAAFMLGGNPGALNGVPADVNGTVSFVTGKYAYVGDFENAFKWGFAKEIPIEIIPYGDPDGNGDLKRLNQVFIRAEAWIGWGILDGSAFARIEAGA